MTTTSSKKGLFWAAGIVGLFFVFWGLSLSLKSPFDVLILIDYIAVLALIMVICHKGTLSDGQTFLFSSLYILLSFGVSGICSIYENVFHVPSYITFDSGLYILQAMGPLCIGAGLILCLFSYMKLFGFRKTGGTEQPREPGGSRQ